MLSKRKFFSGFQRTSAPKKTRFREVETFHSLMFQNPGYRDGNTYLHVAVRNFKNMAEFEDKIKNLDEEVLAAMSLITNDNGQLPLDMIGEIKAFGCSSQDKVKLNQKLLGLMQHGHVKKMNEPIGKAEIQSSSHANNKQLLHNLKLGRDLVNQARKQIYASSTHPQSNDYDKKIQDMIWKEIEEMRKKTNHASISSDKITNVTSYVSQYKKGNCYEFSYVVLDMLRKKSQGLLGEIFSIKYGDHAFVVIARAANSDPKNPATWGDHAVVCDAWSGAVYPAVDIPYRLKNLTSYELADLSHFSALCSFNPRFHQLVKDFELPATNKFKL